MKKKLCAVLTAVLALSLLCACGGAGKEPEQEPVDLSAFVQTVMENHEFPGFMERIDPQDADMGEAMGERLNNFYPGLTDLELEQMEVYMSMISFSGGELTLVQAKDAGDAAKVKDVFQARIDSKTTEGPGNYPEEVEIWQRSAKIADHGSYVMLVCHEDADAIVKEFNDLFNG